MLNCRFKLLFLPLFLFFALLGDLKGQSGNTVNYEELFEHYDEKYGVDFNLVSGLKYINKYANAKGNPFLDGNVFHEGSLEINSRFYEGQLIMYDIYNQQVIAKYNSKLTGIQTYIIPSARLQSFSYNGKVFKRIRTANQDERFYELIADGNYSMLISYDKTYALNRDLTATGFSFSDPILKFYILHDNQLYRFTGNRSFINIFPEQKHSAVRKILNQNKIRVNKPEIKKLKLLMNAINLWE